MYVPFPSCGQAAAGAGSSWQYPTLLQAQGGGGGLGLYESSNWVTPQRLQDDWRSLVSANMQAPNGWGKGLGCACGCGGGPSCSQPGLSGLTMDGSGLFGTGIFGTGVSVTNLSTWSWAEWVAIFLGAYVVYSVFATGRRHVAAAHKSYRKAKARLASRASSPGSGWTIGDTVGLAAIAVVGLYLFQGLSSSQGSGVAG